MVQQVEEIELAYLWGLIQDNDLIDKTSLSSDMFYNSDYGRIFDFLVRVREMKKDIDMLLLKNKLTEVGILERLGWLAWLVSLFENYVSSLHFQDYEGKIKKAYKQRKILVRARKLKKIATDWDDLDEGIDGVYQEINDIMLEGGKNSMTVEDGINKMLKTIEENKGKDLIWWSWWLDFLDEATKWIRKWKTYRIGAPSGLGKTNLAYQTISNLLQQGAKVMFVSLENSIDTTYIKLLSSMQGVSPNDIETGKIAAEVDFIKDFRNHLLITDQLFEWGEITREIKRFKPDVVFLDYIGLVDVNWCDEKTLYNKYADLQKKFIQKNQQIAWVDLSNLNKDDDEERIRMHRWFNGSAKLRNNTDFALHMFYHKPFYEYKKQVLNMAEKTSPEYGSVLNKQVITFLISKNRLWPDGTEEQFYINFEEGIKYNEASKDMKDKWNSLI